MHFIIWSHLSWLSTSAPLYKHHLDQHLRDLSTDRWGEEVHPPPMRTMELSLGSGTPQAPCPLSLNVKLFASPGGRRERWLKYHVLGFRSKKNNERLRGTFSIVIDRLVCPFCPPFRGSWAQDEFVFIVLLRQTLIVLLKTKIDKDALLIGIGACFSLAQGMTAIDGLRENILAQFLDRLVCAAASHFETAFENQPETDKNWILRRNKKLAN